MRPVTATICTLSVLTASTPIYSAKWILFHKALIGRGSSSRTERPLHPGSSLHIRMARVCSTDSSWLRVASSARYSCVIEQLIELGTVQPLPVYDNRIDLVHTRDISQRMGIQQD